MDLDSVLDFIFCPEEKRDVEVSIEETYSNDEETKKLTLDTRTKKENKTSIHSQHENFRYDLFRKMVDVFDETEWDDEKQAPVIQTMTEEICFNTLLQYGFLKKV